MDNLQRIKTLIQMRQPRIKDFLKPFDKLNHGFVTFTQFLRALEQANIQLNTAESQACVNMFGTNNEINYLDAIKFFNQPSSDPRMASTHGSLAGITASFGEGLEDKYDQETEDIIEFLKEGCRKRPVIGKSFFLDYDSMKDGIIVANQFARGLSVMYWAVFRRYPTQQELDKLIYRFWVNRLVHQNMQDFDFEAKTNQSREVDYRSFIKAVGASGPGEGVPDVYIPPPKSNDPSFKLFRDTIPDNSPEKAFEQIKIAQEKFRFDYKAFLQSRDKRKLGIIQLKEFISGCVDAVPDFKRIGLEQNDFKQAASMFIDYEAMEKATYTKLQQTQLQKNILNEDLCIINYRKFLETLLNLPNVNQAAQAGIQNNLQTLKKCDKHPSQLPTIKTIRDYLIEHPVLLRQEFQKFDRRVTGKVSGQQFKQVLAQAIQVFSPFVEAEEEDLRHSAKFIRQNTGITFEELQKVCNFYSVETVSGLGSTDVYSAGPDQLINSGFLVDYITFLKDVEAEVGDYIPSVPTQQRYAIINQLKIQPVNQVLWLIADSLGTRHLKLSDCLNQGEPGSTKWNRTIYGRLGARKVQSSLSNILEVILNDNQLASLAFAFPPQDGIKISSLLPQSQYLEDGILLPNQTREVDLQKILDKVEISIKDFTTNMKEITDIWKPARVTGISFKQENALADEIVVKQEKDKEREGMEVVSIAVKHMQDLTEGKEFNDLVLDQVLTIQGTQVSTAELLQYIKNPQNAQTQIQKAAACILALYLELHIRAANPAPEFREFDKLRQGFVTPDQFSRSFVLATMGHLINKYPKSFNELTQLYVNKQAGRFLGMVDYATMLRELGKPPPNSVFVSLQDQESNVKAAPKLHDYQTVANETQQEQDESNYHASLQGVLKDLSVFCYKYRPKLRDYFLDFDKRRSGVCEASKLGAALSQFNFIINNQQENTLLQSFKSSRFGFNDCFEWRQFIEELEKVTGFRL
ncbi:hypothetical protein SS50377_20070 [Spironucleus salmonicida]|nr:hypothetical protein SS50377_20070 [Spironucleus salmonicida]